MSRAQKEAPASYNYTAFFTIFAISVLFSIFMPAVYQPEDTPSSGNVKETMFAKHNKRDTSKTITLENTNIKCYISPHGGNIYSIKLTNGEKISTPTNKINPVPIKSSQPKEMLWQTTDADEPIYQTGALSIVSEKNSDLSWANYAIVHQDNNRIVLQYQSEQGVIVKTFTLDEHNPYTIHVAVDISGFQDIPLWLTSGVLAPNPYAARGTRNVVKHRTYDPLTETGHRGATYLDSFSSGYNITHAPYTGWVANQNGPFAIILDTENPVYADKLLVFHEQRYTETQIDPTTALWWGRRLWAYVYNKFTTSLNIVNVMLPIQKQHSRWTMSVLPLSHSLLGQIDAYKTSQEGDAACYSSLNDNLGMFSIIIHPISYLLRTIILFIYNLSDNWFLSILCSIIIIRCIISPILILSTRHKIRMKKAHPEIAQVQASGKNNTDTGIKMLEIYRKYNANPWMLILSTIVQIPLLFSAFDVFGSIFEIQGEPLSLFGIDSTWISDLSRPDSIILPIKLPFLGDTISILPFFISASILIHIYVMSNDSNVEKSSWNFSNKLMYAVPIIPLIIMFYNSPAIISLYIGISGILSLVQNTLISKFVEKQEHTTGSGSIPIKTSKSSDKR